MSIVVSSKINRMGNRSLVLLVTAGLLTVYSLQGSSIKHLRTLLPLQSSYAQAQRGVLTQPLMLATMLAKTVKKPVTPSPNPVSTINYTPFLSPHNQWQYSLYMNEIARLKQESSTFEAGGNPDYVSYDGLFSAVYVVRDGKLTSTAQKFTPKIGVFLKDLVDSLAKKAPMQAPHVALILNNPNTLYNACMANEIDTMAIDETLLDLFLWNNKSAALLGGILAHELGHKYHKHAGGSCIEYEYQADEFAIKIIDDPESFLYALHCIHTAGPLFGALSNMPIDLYPGIDQQLHAVKVLSSAFIAATHKASSTFDQCSSYTALGALMALVIIPCIVDMSSTMGNNDIMSSLGSNLVKIGRNNFLVDTINKKFGVDDCSSHPAPAERYANLKKCIAAKKK